MTASKGKGKGKGKAPKRVNTKKRSWAKGAALFQGPEGGVESSLMYRAMLGKLVEYDEAYLAEYPDTPKLYDSGVRCVRQLEGVSDIGSCIVRGEGDVDSLCAWRVAELRRQGIKAEVVLVQVPRPDGGVTFTCRVRLPDGTDEDVKNGLG